ncbi:MAG: MFS transporter [Alphaproteobacteria bacterium]|nr:MFS transporter [Alphaproteobacteria bacterium]
MLWIASVVSSIGTWMQDVGSAWLMVTLTTHPLMVASIQAITSFSIFLFVLPAGAKADIIEQSTCYLGFFLIKFLSRISFLTISSSGSVLLFMVFCG